MATALGDAIEQALGFMAQFMSLPDGGSIVVNTDFGVRAGGEDLRSLLDAVNAGQISREMFWAEWKRRGVLSDSFQSRIGNRSPH